MMTARNMFYSKDKQFSNAEKKLFVRDDFIFNVTEDILCIMEEKNISKTKLAILLGKNKSYITQVLSGSRNMTLGSLSDICFALGVTPELVLPVGENPDYVEIEEHKEWINSNTYLRKQEAKTSNVINIHNRKEWKEAA
jgi:transcriptional regulator with XRE-family HTH domain